jgi:hypothetical protein
MSMDGQLYRDHIHSELGGFFSQGHAEGTFTTGTFAYDEDTLRGLVGDWQAISSHYQGSIAAATNMGRVSGPGTDFASEAQANASNNSAASYHAYLERNARYCDQQAQVFQNALDDYLGIEHRNVTEINKSGRSSGI